MHTEEAFFATLEIQKNDEFYILRRNETISENMPLYRFDNNLNLVCKKPSETTWNPSEDISISDIFTDRIKIVKPLTPQLETQTEQESAK